MNDHVHYLINDLIGSFPNGEFSDTVSPKDEDSYKNISIIEDKDSKLKEIIGTRHGKYYMAKSKLSNKVYAVKQIQKTKIKGDISDYIESIGNMYNFQLRLDYKSIIKVYSKYENNNMILIIQEYFESVSLYKFIMQTIKGKHILTDESIFKIFYQLLALLHFLRSHNLVHRMINAESILVDRECDIKLTNFKHAYQSDNIDRTFVGMKYCKISREKNFPRNFEVDIFSVGVLLFQMINSLNLYKNNVLFADPLTNFKHFHNSDMNNIMKSLALFKIYDHVLDGVMNELTLDYSSIETLEDVDTMNSEILKLLFKHNNLKQIRRPQIMPLNKGSSMINIISKDNSEILDSVFPLAFKKHSENFENRGNLPFLINDDVEDLIKKPNLESNDDIMNAIEKVRRKRTKSKGRKLLDANKSMLVRYNTNTDENKVINRILSINTISDFKSNDLKLKNPIEEKDSEKIFSETNSHQMTINENNCNLKKKKCFSSSTRFNNDVKLN